MDEIRIVPYELSHESEVEAIFWLTSARIPEDHEKESFRKKYLDDYLSLMAFVALRNERVVGYILCQPDSFKAPLGLEIFRAQFADYPAHLHINLHPEAQGGGLGGKLLGHLEAELEQREISGVHLVTHSLARNVSFYEKNHYLRLDETPQKLLCLGKKLRVKNL